MSFAEKLKQEQDTRFEDYAIEFAGEIESALVESAREGYTGYEIKLSDRDDKHILSNRVFQKKLELLLDGCKVKTEQKKFRDLLFKRDYYRNYLVINWN